MEKSKIKAVTDGSFLFIFKKDKKKKYGTIQLATPAIGYIPSHQSQ
jgi:hypothetical protein